MHAYNQPGGQLVDSGLRRQNNKGKGFLLRKADVTVRDMHVTTAGEIYDILPWDDAIMPALARLMNELEPLFDDGENVLPPPCQDCP